MNKNQSKLKSGVFSLNEKHEGQIGEERNPVSILQIQSVQPDFKYIDE